MAKDRPGIFCGFDFGTSNSALSLIENNEVRLAPLEGAEATIPSAIFFDENGHVLFGRAAMSAYTGARSGRFMRSFKRVLGTGLMNEGTLVGRRRLSFENIIGQFVSHIKSRAEMQYGGTLERVVVGRPVRFFEDDAQAEKEAGDQLHRIFSASGFKEVKFQFEPIAAAFAHEISIDDDREYVGLVVDIGGGTSDFTAIRLARRYAQKSDRSGDVLANRGLRIGGNDFDRQLSLKCFMPDFGYGTTYGEKSLPFPATPFFDLSEWSRIPLAYRPRSRDEARELLRPSHAPQKISKLLRLLDEERGHELLGVVEAAKIALGETQKTDAAIDFINERLELKISRADFNEAIGKATAAIVSAIKDCLSAALLEPSDIDIVILTGGGTGIPLIRETIAAIFPCARLSEANRFSSVGLGLGYDALRAFSR